MYRSKVHFKVNYDSFRDLYNDIINIKGRFSYLLSPDNFFFRGVSDTSHQLIPSSLRIGRQEEFSAWDEFGRYKDRKLERNQVEYEKHLLLKFYNKADAAGLSVPPFQDNCTNEYNENLYSSGEKWISNDFYKIAALAQHHGVPTRLLDWTRDINVALYFACSGKNSYKKGDRMGIWFLKNTDIYNAQYSRGQPGRSIQEKLIIIRPECHDNDYMRAQKGLFTLWQIDYPEENSTLQIDRKPLDVLIDDLFCDSQHDDMIIGCITLPRHESKNVFKYLERIQYDATKLFPSYEGVTRWIEDKSFFRKLFWYKEFSRIKIGQEEFEKRVFRFLVHNAIFAKKHNNPIDCRFIQHYGKMNQKMGYSHQEYELLDEDVTEYISGLTDIEVKSLLERIMYEMENLQTMKIDISKLLLDLGHKEPLSDKEIITIFHNEIRRLQVERDLDNDELKDNLLGVEE